MNVLAHARRLAAVPPRVGASGPGEAPVRVCRIIARLIVGGPTIHVLELTQGLDPARFSSTLIVGQANAGEQSLVNWARARGIAPYEVPEIVGELSVKPRDLRAVLALYRLLRRERPHIVHTHTAKAGVVGRLAAWLAGVPVLVHTYHGHILQGYFHPVINAALRFMERWLARRTTCLIAVSERTRCDLVRYGIGHRARIEVVPLGVNLEPFLEASRLSGQFRAELGVGLDRRLVGIVGRVVPIKNHPLFLRALARVAERDPRVLGVIVGDGPLLADLRDSVDALSLRDRVVFTGWRMDLARVYADLDVLVVSSRNEGTPVSIIEAMAAGRAVVATAVGGIPDMITDGETGRLVAAGDEVALAGAVLDILGKPDVARAMGERARQVAVARYGAARLVRDMEALYTDLLRAMNRRGMATRDDPLARKP